ncbi:outer membrane beta-barrel protein [Halothiobacillus sp.]|uniref:outer membrane beta-barrel protein n=1 Tax=Halothiobacillus sp. TaxID=1891311 RepID=UPI002632FD25|nr:outer membrane beta-barrel protein [Halothiobacillus sp.]
MKLRQVKDSQITATLSLLVIAMMAGPMAVADDSGWYIGANAGQSRATIDNDRITRNLLGSGFTTNALTNDDRDIGYKLYGGYQFNRYFALEGGYFNLGKFGYTAYTTPQGSLTGEIKLQGVNLDVVGLWPITDKFSLFGRVGVNYAKAQDQFVGTGAVLVTNPSPSARDTNYKFGVGAQYALTESLDVRAEVERYRINDAVGNKGDIDLISAGLVYRFGQKAREPALVPVAAAPLAAIPAHVVEQQEPKKVTLSADSLFDFNKSVVKPAGKRELDQLARDLNGTDYDQIMVIGHTDRIGSHAYNLKLSTRRAEAVKDYLISSGQIPAHKISAKGVDGADPVTKPGDCVGSKATPALIACLQPDRRVEVDVSGTK